LSAAGKTLIVLTHELEKLAAHATRIVILSEGRVVCDATPQTILGLETERYGLRNPLRAVSGIGDLSWLS
jgi:biotin transport system ATP-binding protein